MATITRRALLWLSGGLLGAGAGLGANGAAADAPVVLLRDVRIAGDAYYRIRDGRRCCRARLFGCAASLPTATMRSRSRC